MKLAVKICFIIPSSNFDAFTKINDVSSDENVLISGYFRRQLRNVKCYKFVKNLDVSSEKRQPIRAQYH